MRSRPEERPVRWYFPWSWFQPTPWDSGFELGINGATGTSDTLSVRTGGYIKRDTGRNKIDLSLYYNKTTADGDETQNNAIMKARNDRMLGQSPWSIFVMSQLFYDEFQAFDLNVNINSGIGFKVFDEDWVKLRTSLGAGASREFGGVDEEWTPEAQCGFDWEQKITETQKFYAGVDFFPEFGDFGNYRVLTDMGLEIELSRPSNVSLKISATDRYDSQSDGFEAPQHELLGAAVVEALIAWLVVRGPWLVGSRRDLPMSPVSNHPSRRTMSDLADLQSVLDAEIPMCGQMGIRVLEPADGASTLEDGLRMRMPLDRNRNHQLTAFAGSLNALCTIAGWGSTYLLVRALQAEGAIVIRRSSIKYHRPVETDAITAHCLAPAPEAREYFREMLLEKRQAKLDLTVEIASSEPGEDRPAVAFHGSYVVTAPDEDRAHQPSLEPPTG